MRLSQDLKPVSYFKNNMAEVLRRLNESRGTMIITQNGEPRAVIQDPKSFENMRNAIGILKLISIGEEVIRNGHVLEEEDMFKN